MISNRRCNRRRADPNTGNTPITKRCTRDLRDRGSLDLYIMYKDVVADIDYIVCSIFEHL